MMKMLYVKRATGIVLATGLAISQLGVTEAVTVKAGDNTSELESLTWQATDLVVNGDFETGDETGWEITMPGADGDSVGHKVYMNEWASNHTNFFNFWNNHSNGEAFSMSQDIELSEGTYKLGLQKEGENAETGLVLSMGDTELELGSTSGWDKWEKLETSEFVVSEPGKVTLRIAGELSSKYWGDIDDIVLYKLESADSQDKPVEADVTVEKIKNLSEDFITGADVSSYFSVINSGAKFYDKSGNVLTEQGFFDLLAAGGTNYIRVRVWNNPYDDKGNGYGGGNNDLETAKIIGQYATKAGMKVLVDFHYSDFWADPGKQKAPKAWASMSAGEKAQAVGAYTRESVKYLLDEGVNVGMVQIGNETTNSVCGINFGTETEAACALFDAGCDAVHALADQYDREILAAIHFTNPERAGNYARFAERLKKYDVSYDVFASSYYPYWHGTLKNLTSELKGIADNYGKKVMVAETSWAWTLDDGDGWDNTVRKNNNDSNNSENFRFSVQGQCTEIREVAQAVANVGEAGIGLFYWEAAWIPVQYAYKEDGSLNTDILDSNKEAWETKGSGWASSYATEYDPNDAGKWYGGSAVDNQAWFDFAGKELATVNVYNYIRTGSVSKAELEEIQVDDITVEAKDAAAVKLPETVKAIYSDESTKELAASWNNDELAAAVKAGVGEYAISGSVELDGKSVSISLKLIIVPDNLIVNGDFENGLNDWEISDAILNTKDAASNSYSGEGCLHFYTANEGDSATARQKLVLNKGYYDARVMLQGGNAGEQDQYGIRVTVGNDTYKGIATLDGWKSWTMPSIAKIRVPEDNTEVVVELFVSNMKAGAWGSFDDAKLYKVADLEEPGQPDQPEQPEEPDQPSQPEEPDKPEQPEEPDQPNQPEEPDQPSQPEEPDQPSQPEEPDKPEQPEEPDKSEQPALKDNRITGVRKSYSLTRSSKPFTLKASANGAKITFASLNSKVVKVDKNTGRVTVKGTGTTTIIVKALANAKYKQATLSIKVTVKPDKAKLTKLTRGKNSVSLKWKKLSSVSGYKLQISTDKKFRSKYTKSVYVSYKKANLTLKKLKSNKKYYVRICGYKNIKLSGKTVKLYGEWSKTTSFVTKK